MQSETSPRLVVMAENVRSFRVAQAERAQKLASELKGYPIYLNVYEHRDSSGHCYGRSYDEYTGPYAKASAAEDANSLSRNAEGMSYVETIIIRSDTQRIDLTEE